MNKKYLLLSTATVVAVAGVGILPVFAATDDSLGDVSSPNVSVHEDVDVLVAEESMRKYMDISAGVSAAGVGVGDDGVVVVRIYADDNSGDAELAFAAEGLRPLIFSSQYTREALANAEDSLRAINLNEGEAFAFHYSPVDDLLLITGTVSADSVGSALPVGFPYRLDYTAATGRA